MRTITNNTQDARVLDLGAEGERGPFLVTQTGVAPGDELCRDRFFVLRPDGKWADFNAYVAKGQPEAIDAVVFPTMSKVLETLNLLRGKPQVDEMPVDEAGLKAWLAKQKVQYPVQAAEQWATQYKMRHPKR